MKIKINEKGFVESPYIQDATQEIEITDEQFNQIANFPFKHNWKYEDGAFSLVKIIQDSEENLRERREKECFSVINRGQLWYDSLTRKQRKELETWYNAWLNVTETNIIPEKPEWL